VDQAQLLSWVASFSYPAVFVLLLMCGLGLPLSEDLVLLTGGIVAAKGDSSLPGMMLAAYAGLLAGDSTLFFIGRKLGPRATQHRLFKKILTADRVAWVQAQFHRRGSWMLFLVRFLPGFRAPTYLVAGMSAVPYRKFIVADGLAAAISAPLLTFLGWKFGLTVLKDLEATGRYLVGGAIVAVLIGLGVRRFRARRIPAPSPSAVRPILRDVHDSAEQPATPYP
jgi:membrane-associated protein